MPIGSPPFHPMSHPTMSPQSGRSLAGTPQPFHPYNRPVSRQASPAGHLKSALEMRSMGNYSHINNYAAQMAQINPYVRQMQQQQMQAQWQQQQIQQQFLRHAQINNQPSFQPRKPTVNTNHSISAMINSDKTNKPKKLAFSISALVGEDSESEIEETEVEHEVVDVVSDQNSEHESIEPFASPCHSAGNDSHDSGNVSANSAIGQPIIDDDLRRALTIDPRSLSVEEKQRLRQKLAEIALRNISQDSGVCTSVC